MASRSNKGKPIKCLPKLPLFPDMDDSADAGQNDDEFDEEEIVELKTGASIPLEISSPEGVLDE